MPDTLSLVLVVVIVALVAFLLFGKRKPAKNSKIENEEEESESYTKKTKEPLNLDGAYQKRWMFSYHEKDAYAKIKEAANKHGLSLFAKVRLLDLLEPVKGNPKYKTFFYKVQAKHVDFVLCDEKLVAKYIIELDDSSHDEKSRQERDSFVDKILTSVGYKILHTRAVSAEQLNQFFQS